MEPSDPLFLYNGYDACATAQVFGQLMGVLAEHQLTDFYFRHVHPLTLAVQRMSRRGVLVDQQEVARLRAEYLPKLEAMGGVIVSQIGDWFRPGNRYDLRKFCYESMHLTPYDYTAKGTPQVDAATLAHFVARAPIRWRPLFQQILEYNEVEKVCNVYLNPAVGPDGRLRESFNVAATRTGRLGARLLQTVPKSLRTMFVAPPGKVLVAADASQLELRLIAYATSAERLIFALEGGADVHAMNARDIEGLAPDAPVERKLRDDSKTFVYEIIYGASARRVQKQLLKDMCKYMETDGSAGIQVRMDRFFAANPQIRAAQERWYEEALRTRRIVNEYGRPRNIFAPEEEIRGIAYNTRIQSTAADYMNGVFERVDQAFEAAGAARLILYIHDEVVAEAHEADVDQAAYIIKREMETPQHIFGREITLPAEVKVGHSWGSMQKWS